MDKKTKRSILLFLLTQLTLPVCLVLGYVNHTPFIPVSKWAVSLLLAAVSVTITTKLQDRQLPSWASLLSVAAFANAAALLGQGIFGGIGAIVCFWCGWTMVKCSGRGFLRGLCYVTSTLATTALILAMPLWGFVQIMHHTQVIRKVPSPDQRYTAILKSIDEGALGGDTVVEVLDHERSVHILLGRFTASEILWRGDWGAHERMSLSWEDGDTLTINGISYDVSGEDVPLIAEISQTQTVYDAENRVLCEYT